MSNARSKAANKRRLFQAKAKVTRSGAKAKAPSTAKVSSSARRGARVKASNAQVTQSGGKGSGNAVVTKSGGKIASGPSYKSPSVPKPAAGAAKGARAAAGKAGAAGALGKGAALVGAAAAGLNAGPVADGTMKGKPTGAKKGPAANQPKNFNEAFKQARSRGVKEFTYKGKRYHTRRADGK